MMTYKISMAVHIISIIATGIGMVLSLALEADDVVLSLNAYCVLITAIALLQTMRAR